MIIWMGLAALAFWYWWDTQRAKETAHDIALRACAQASVQFLDETVAHRRVRPQRDADGRLRLCRTFSFEFTTDGARRYEGRVVLLGQRVQQVDLDAHRLPVH
jgi:hypothetical protein